MLRTVAVGPGIILSLAFSSHALAVASFEGHINDNTGYQNEITGTDLLQTNLSGVPALTGDFNKEGVAGMGEPTLRNGSFENLGGQQGATAGTTDGNSDVIVYTLDTAASPLGYTINQVNTFAGWSYGRYGQGYNVSFHVVGTPAGTFNVLPSIDVSYGPGTGEDAATSAFPQDVHGNFSTSVAITDPSGIIATGVDQVKFTFGPGPNYVGNYNGYRELDVIGSAVPEPTSLAALGLGGVTLLARRRRHA